MSMDLEIGKQRAGMGNSHSVCLEHRQNESPGKKRQVGAIHSFI